MAEAGSIPLGVILRNATELLTEAAEDAQRLQNHISEVLPQSQTMLDNVQTVRVLQSLDPLTQTLCDLSTAFQLLSEREIGQRITNWNEVIDALKLERVGQALTHGDINHPQPSHVELF